MKLSLAFVTLALLFASVHSISLKMMLNRQEATSQCGPDPCHSFDSSVTTSAGAEMVRIPISVAVDTTDPRQLSTYAPTSSSSQSSQSPYQSFSQSSGSSASRDSGSIGYPTPKPFRKAPPASPAAVAAVLSGIAKMANTVPKGVTITTTSNIGAQMFTTTITHHDDPKAPVIGAAVPPPAAPAPSRALSGSSDISDLPSFFPKDMSSMISNPSSSSSSLSPPSLDSIKLPQPPAPVAPLPSESSASSSSIPPIPASSPASGDGGDDDCGSGACSRRGKIKINSNVEVSIGKKKSQQEKEAAESSLSDESSSSSSVDSKIPSAGSSAGAPPVTALKNK